MFLFYPDFLAARSAVGAFCKTPGNRLSALFEPFGAHGGRFAKRPYSSNAADNVKKIWIK